MVNTNNIDNMDNPDSLYCVLFRNGVNYGMCCINNAYDKTLLERCIDNNELRRDNMDYIKNEDKTTKAPNIGEGHVNLSSTTNQSQEAKADNGKPKLTLVPDQIIYDIAEVREYGNQKYGDPNNWKTVEIERYRDAAFRHFLAYLREPDGKDEESGIEHLKHLACNIAFLCALEKNKKEG